MRVLLADRSVEELAIYGQAPGPSAGGLQGVDRLDEWDVLVTDHPDQIDRLLGAALDGPASVVLWSDEESVVAAASELADDFARLGMSLVVGSNLRSGIGPALLAHQVLQVDEALEFTLAWTEEGRPLRRGLEALFPDPVGPLWARAARLTAPTPGRLLAAPLEGPWSGAVARVTAVVSEGVAVRTVGVADDDLHLQSLALAAGALTAESFSPGLHWPAEAAQTFLDHALRCGLEVAAFSEAGRAGGR